MWTAARALRAEHYDVAVVLRFDAETGALTHTLAAHACPAMRVAFSPDGHHLASTGMVGAVFVWRVTMQDTLLNYLAWVILSICGARIFFNFNPLMKLDGYYLLSDWLEIPNLRQRGLDRLMASVRCVFWGGPRPDKGMRFARELAVNHTRGLSRNDTRKEGEESES